MIRSKDPLQGSPLRDQLPGNGLGLRSFGKVEVVSLHRRSRKHPELLLFKGSPSSAHSVAKSVLVTLVPDSEALPAPHFDRAKGRIHLFYHSDAHPDVKMLVEHPGDCVCYLWTSANGEQSHAWLLKAR